MKKILLLSHCILNPCSKAKGLLNEKGLDASRRFIKSVLNLEIGVIQLPCPELLYKGLDREPASKKTYDNSEFRNVCAEVADRIVELIREYEEVGIRVIAYVGIEGSPSCGVEWTHIDEGVATKGRGVFTEVLLKAINDAGLRTNSLGLPEKEKYGSIEDLLRKVEDLK